MFQFTVNSERLKLGSFHITFATVDAVGVGMDPMVANGSVGSCNASK